MTTQGVNATSPQTYSTTGCFKGFVVQVNDYLTQEASGPGEGEGGSAAGTAAAFVMWVDSPPTNKTECEAAINRSYLFEQQPSGGFDVADFRSASGIWIGSSCAIPAVEFAPELLVPGHSYKIASTARTSYTPSAPTRQVQVIVH